MGKKLPTLPFYIDTIKQAHQLKYKYWLLVLKFINAKLTLFSLSCYLLLFEAEKSNS